MLFWGREGVSTLFDILKYDPPSETAAFLDFSGSLSHLGHWRKSQRCLWNQPGPSAGPSECLFVPPALRWEVLHWGHSSKLTSHPGVQRRMLLRMFWCYTVEEELACPICNQHKSSNQSPDGYLHPLPIPYYPWSHISLDFVTGLPPS